MVSNNPGYEFYKYGGGNEHSSCQGAKESDYFQLFSTTCIVNPSASTDYFGYYNAKLYWDPVTYSVDLSTSGTGSGEIRDNFGGTCRGECTKSYPHFKNGAAKFTAVADSGSIFTGFTIPIPAYSTPDNCTPTGNTPCTFYFHGPDSSYGGQEFLIANFKKVENDTQSNIEPEAEPEEETKSFSLDSINSNNFEQEAKLSLNSGKLKVSGQGPPNTTFFVTLYSDPITAEVTTDDFGYWEHEFSDVEPGTHRLVAETKDEDGNVVQSTEIAQFEVLAETTSQETNLPEAPVNTNNNYWWIIWPILFALVLALYVWLYFKSKKHPIKFIRSKLQTEDRKTQETEKDSAETDKVERAEE